MPLHMRIKVQKTRPRKCTPLSMPLKINCCVSKKPCLAKISSPAVGHGAATRLVVQPGRGALRTARCDPWMAGSHPPEIHWRPKKVSFCLTKLKTRSWIYVDLYIYVIYIYTQCIYVNIYIYIRYIYIYKYIYIICIYIYTYIYIYNIYIYIQ